MWSDEPKPGGRILLVEDEAIIAFDLKRRLERLGYEVVGIADNSADALALALQTNPMLVFMDVVIQGPMDGVETADRLVRLMDVPVVFLTAHSDAATIKRAKYVRPYGYLVKPFEERELYTTIEMALYRHQTEAQARLLQQAVAGATTGIVIADARQPEAPIAFCNEAFERITGYGMAEVIGRSAGFVLGPDTDPGARAEVDRAIGAKSVCQVTLRTHRKDGRPFWNDLTLSVVRNAIGDVTHLLFFHTDVTARKQAEDALRQSQKMEAIGRLTGGVAHDFNNILTVILSFTDFVYASLPQDDPRRDDLAEVLGAGERAAALTRQLLAFSRQQPPIRRPIELNTHIGQLLRMLRLMVGEGVHVEFNASPRQAIVRADPVQIDQILLNLAVNARDAMPGGGALRLSVSHPDDVGRSVAATRCVRLVVADTGVGMPPEILARAFEPFFSTKGSGKGTGLGLAISQSIINDSNGTIRADSEPGCGTTFTIDLPICDEPVLDASADMSRAYWGAGKSVLVVDDDPALLTAAVRTLQSADYRVVQARNGDEAIARLDDPDAKFDLVLTDVVMPGSGGYAVMEHAARFAPETRVLLTSGYVDAGGELVGREEPPLLWKPYTQTSLLRAVHGALAPTSSDEGGTLPTVPFRPRSAVLLVEDDSLIRLAFESLLRGAGYDVVGVDGVASARARLETGQPFAVVICDLSLSDGSGADLVRWITTDCPSLAPRVLILTGGAVDDAGRIFLEETGASALHKPVRPSVLLTRVGALAAIAPSADLDGGSTKPVAPQPTSIDARPVAQVRGAILLVDDDGAQRDAYGRVLRSAGFHIHGAASGEEAIAVIEQQALDAVVTDIALPGVDGLAVLRAARAKDADLPVLLMTGAPSIETATTAIQRRAVAYLAKPFAMEQLLHEVERAVEEGQIARLQQRLLASRAGVDEFLADIQGTRRKFDAAMNGLHVLFQPIVRSHDASIFGYEALLRSHEPTLSTPLRFLAAADVLGRADELGRAVRAAVAATLRDHPERTEVIFVNLHPGELRSDLLCSAAEPLLQMASRVVFEVTERTSLVLGAPLAQEVASLRNAGYRIAIDDLGAGYTGLSSLVQIRPDIAKIDHSLVRDAPRSSFKRELLASLIRVCRRARITVVGEGVNTEDEAQLLTELGCDLLQGYLFSRPGPAFPGTSGLREEVVR